MRVAVVGAGSWGTTLANLLAGSGHRVSVWAREPEVVESITKDHVNTLFLPDAPLSPTITAHGDIRAAVEDAELIVVAAPSEAVRSVGETICQAVNGTKPLTVSVAKGLEPGSCKTMTSVLSEVLPECPVVALSGPSFAREVYEQQPTAVVAAAQSREWAETVQRAFATSRFRVYTSEDTLGVQLGGALKNVIALAAGILDGLGLGHNPRAALITRGLAEITRLGLKLGAQATTFAGLAGMGDLILTATGGLSRNRSLGVELGRGRKLTDIMAERRSVAEGINTARVAGELAERTNVELPIAAEVSSVLFDGKEPRKAIGDLMERALKPEHWQ